MDAQTLSTHLEFYLLLCYAPRAVGVGAVDLSDAALPEHSGFTPAFTPCRVSSALTLNFSKEVILARHRRFLPVHGRISIFAELA